MLCECQVICLVVFSYVAPSSPPPPDFSFSSFSRLGLAIRRLSTEGSPQRESSASFGDQNSRVWKSLNHFSVPATASSAFFLSLFSFNIAVIFFTRSVSVACTAGTNLPRSVQLAQVRTSTTSSGKFYTVFPPKTYFNGHSPLSRHGCASFGAYLNLVVISVDPPLQVDSARTDEMRALAIENIVKFNKGKAK